MAHREDFTMIRDAGGQMSMCDVCASIIPNEQSRLRTFIGNSGQSDICDDCANTVADLVIAERKKTLRASVSTGGTVAKSAGIEAVV